MRPPSPIAARPARIFAEQKCLAADKCHQICCSAERSLDIVQTGKCLQARKRVLPKYVGDARLVKHCKSGTPGISKGPQPFCFRKSPEKTLLKGFLWAISSRRLDTALLCAAKKRGVELNQLAGFFQKQTGACRHRRQKQKAPFRRAIPKKRTCLPAGSFFVSTYSSSSSAGASSARIESEIRLCS